MTERPGVERIAAALTDHWNMWALGPTDSPGPLATALYDAGLRVVDSPEPGPFGVRVVSESSNLPGFRAATPAPPEPDETRVFDSPDEMFDAIRALAAPSGPALDVERLARAVDTHFRTGRHGYSTHACGNAVAAEYARLTGAPE